MRFQTVPLFLFLLSNALFAQQATEFQLAKTIRGNITPKSIAHDGNGNFYAQNMMYAHGITVYNRDYRLVKTIEDKVKLSAYGYEVYQGEYKGAPVEAAPSHCGKWLWVTNYRMTGAGFENPGSDNCSIGSNYDSSFVYRINTQTHKIDAVVQVGCVPKYIAVSPDNQYALVSNWCSGDLSVIDTEQNKEVKRLAMGRYPRGIAIDSKSDYAYIAIMGGSDIARVSLHDFSVEMIENIGSKPRHLCIDAQDKFLYASLNAENKVVKIDLETLEVVDAAKTQTTPRSMAISNSSGQLFVVNYNSGSLSVIAADSMKTLQTVKTGERPIGVTYDPAKNEVWVACYSGAIQVFKNVPKEDEKKEAATKKTEVAPPVQKDSVNTADFQYHIIVGAFKEEQNLKKMLQRCIKAGYQPYIINPDDKVKKVSCIGFTDKPAALEALETVKGKFEPGAWLMKKAG